MDAQTAVDKEVGKVGKRLYYGFYCFPAQDDNYRYLFYRNAAVAPGSSKKMEVTVVYMEGKITLEELKRMFMAVFVFHDTGKVNDNFQYSRMLNRLFKHRKTEILVPAYGHSFLSAWLFLAFELDRVWQDPCLTEEEKNKGDKTKCDKLSYSA